MTRDEILKLKANRDTNALVAERVMKWQAWTEQRGQYTYFIWQQKGKSEPYYQSRDWKAQKERYAKIGSLEFDPRKHIEAGLHNFTGDTVVAFNTLDLWLSDHPTYSSDIETVNTTNGRYHDIVLWGLDGEKIEHAIAETRPLAICRVLLLMEDE